MRPACIIAFLAVLGSCVHADMARFDPTDKRMDQKVTVETVSTKLEDVAKSLTEQSGVTVKAGAGTRDWKVRERRVTIQAKDVPLGQLIDQIERLLGYYVSREGKEGEWTYIIWQDKKSRDLEAEMVTAAKEDAARRAREVRQSALDAAEKALKLTPQEAAKLKDKDPLTAYMATSKSGRGFAQLLSSMQSQFPTEYDLMMRGRKTFLPVEGMPGTLAGATADAAAGGLGKAMRQMTQAKEQPSPYQIVFMPFNGNGQTDAGLMGVSGLMFITGLMPGQAPQNSSGMWGGGLPMGMFPIAGEDSPFGKLFGKALFALDDGMPLDQLNKQFESDATNSSFLADSIARKSATEENPPTDPELTREIEIDAKAMPSGLKEVLRGNTSTESQGKAVAEISRALGMPTLLESFASDLPIALFVKPGKQPLYNVLIAFEKGGYLWDRTDGMLRIRSQDWALKRSYEIPESFIAFYKDVLDKEGQFALDDLANMAFTLTDEQIQNTLAKEPGLSLALGSLAIGFGSGTEILRLYGSFTPQQKEALNSESGLLFAQLSDDQWERTSNIITDSLGGVVIADGNIRLQPQSDSDTKTGNPSRTFDITVSVNGQQDPLTTTEYVYIASKDSIARIKEMRKKAEEAPKKPDANEPNQQPGASK